MSTTKDFNVRYNFAWHAKTHDTLIYVIQSKCEPAAWVCSVSSPLSIACWSVFNWWCWHHACSCCMFKKIMWGIRFLFFCFSVRSGACIWSPLSLKKAYVYALKIYTPPADAMFYSCNNNRVPGKTPSQTSVLSTECDLLYIFKGQPNQQGFISQ